MIIKEDIIKIREQLSIEEIYLLLEQLGAEPRMSNNDDCIISKTICHNGDSHKLYYYNHNHMFYCYTNCGSFDIFELIKKVKGYELYSAIGYISNIFNIKVDYKVENTEGINKETYETFLRYYKINNLKNNLKMKFERVEEKIEPLPAYDTGILNRFAKVTILPWIRDGISKETMEEYGIRYYPGAAQIVIPHYDINNRLIGIRGRQLGREEAKIFGKYRPIYFNNTLFAHPLGMNLYNLNKSKDNIKKMKVAIIFEAEKSCMLYHMYFGKDYDISVACCGSAISNEHIRLLKSCGAEKVIIAFDRQFQDIGDKEFIKLKEKILKLNDTYRSEIQLEFIFDKRMITGYKDSPIDDGPDKFLRLYKERITL